MTRTLLPLTLLLGLILTSCLFKKQQNPIEEALSSKNPLIKRVMDSLHRHELQIRYTQIDRKKDSIVFTDYDFQVAKNNYFYPASTVKFPVVVATLEKLNELDSLSVDTRFYIEGDSVETTFAKAISEIFAVSDNAANNRLIEFLGQDDVNRRLHTRGIEPFRLAHRLSVPDADDITTKPLVIYLNDSTIATSKSIINKYPTALDLNKIKKRIAFYEDDSLQLGKFDFSLKNYFPIASQHNLLKRIIFPETFPDKERFKLNEAQRKLLLDAMYTLPKNLGYDTSEYYDSYVKFFMFGDSTDPIPDYIKIYNKVGYAYGTLTDCAYIKDVKNNIDFMVTAAILVNDNQVFNDNTYEYDEVGIPFLAQLGRELYNYELKREQ